MILRSTGLFLASLLAFSACQDDGPKAKTFDCATIPDAPLEITQLEEGDRAVWPTGVHDVAFDAEGWIAGFNTGAIVLANRAGERRVLTTAIGSAEGMEFLPDGRLVVASDEGIVAISPDGAVVPLAPHLQSAFSIVVGPDGMIYSGDNDRIHRIDPDTGATETYLDSVASARVLNWSPDRRILYVGTFGEAVYAVDVGEDLIPVGQPRLLASLPGAQYQDGLAVDGCGNIYIPVWPDKLYRITPEGTFTIYHHWPDMDFYGHGLKWGSGVGGWHKDALYMPQPWNDSTGEGTLYTVVEVVAGVPGLPPGGFPRPSATGDPHELTCAATGRRTRPPLAPLLLLPLALLLLRRHRPPHPPIS